METDDNGPAGPIWRTGLKCLAFLAIVVAAFAAQPRPLSAQETAPAARQRTSPVNTADLSSWLDGFFRFNLEQGAIAGAVVVVVGDGEVLLQRGYGDADVAAGAPVDPERTLFRIGSATKLFVATAVMQLVEQGRLDLDRDINAYLDFRIPSAPGRTITTRHLLTHTAGFEETVKDFWVSDPSRMQPLGAYLRTHIPSRIYPAGEVPAYSNYGMALAAYIVERVSSEPFPLYLERHVFQPLEMRHSTLRQPLPRELATGMSQGYGRASGSPLSFEYLNPAPAGAISATGADMGRFMIAHLNGGRLGERAILRPQTANLMHAFSLPAPAPLRGMGLGFQPYSLGERTIIGHGGDTNIFHSSLRLYLDEGIGIFVSLNSSGRDGAGERLVRDLTDEFARRYLPIPVAPTTDAPAGTADWAAGLAGTYEGSRQAMSSFLSLYGMLSQFRVQPAADGSLRLARFRDKGRPILWRPIAPWVWKQPGEPNYLVAQADSAGRVMRFRTNNATRVFLRVPFWRSATLNRPVLIGSALCLMLTIIAWPVAAIARRRYTVPISASRNDRLAYRLARLAAVNGLLILGGWWFILYLWSSGAIDMDDRLDPWLRLLQIMGLLSIAGVAAGGWNIWRAWHRTGWTERVWSVPMTIACAGVVWLIFAFRLMRFDLTY